MHVNRPQGASPVLYLKALHKQGDLLLINRLLIQAKGSHPCEQDILEGRLIGEDLCDGAEKGSVQGLFQIAQFLGLLVENTGLFLNKQWLLYMLAGRDILMARRPLTLVAAAWP